jgi:hypothetical protein
VIASADNNSFILVLGEEFQYATEGLVIGKNLVDLRRWVITVTSMINPASLDQKEESLIAVPRAVRAVLAISSSDG